jgi:hypothetical protein
LNESEKNEWTEISVAKFEFSRARQKMSLLMLMAAVSVPRMVTLILLLLHKSSSFVPQCSRHVTSPLYSKSHDDGNDGKLTNEQIANGIFVDRSNDENVPQRPTFSVDEKLDENGTRQRPTFSMKEKQQENDKSLSSVNINGKDVSGAAPNRNAEASNDRQESSASENASNVTNENTSLTLKTREKEAFPVFSAFFCVSGNKICRKIVELYISWCIAIGSHDGRADRHYRGAFIA